MGVLLASHMFEQMVFWLSCMNSEELRKFQQEVNKRQFELVTQEGEKKRAEIAASRKQAEEEEQAKAMHRKQKIKNFLTSDVWRKWKAEYDDLTEIVDKEVLARDCEEIFTITFKINARIRHMVDCEDSLRELIQKDLMPNKLSERSDDDFWFSLHDEQLHVEYVHTGMLTSDEYRQRCLNQLEGVLQENLFDDDQCKILFRDAVELEMQIVARINTLIKKLVELDISLSDDEDGRLRLEELLDFKDD